jgi:hypothetical protein
MSGNMESPNCVILFESSDTHPIMYSSFSVLFIKAPPIYATGCLYIIRNQLHKVNKPAVNPQKIYKKVVDGFAVSST